MRCCAVFKLKKNQYSKNTDFTNKHKLKKYVKTNPYLQNKLL